VIAACSSPCDAHPPIDSGFAIRRVEELAPSEAQIAEAPDLAEELERPMILMISAQR